MKAQLFHRGGTHQSVVEPNLVLPHHTKGIFNMPRATTMPNPPNDYAERASLPLVRRDADLVAAAAERILCDEPYFTPREKRVTDMLCFPLENVPSWIKHHTGEAWSSFSEFAARGGIMHCREIDDLNHVCDLFAKMPEVWADRLEACFVGLEREADPDSFFRDWYAAIISRYHKSLVIAQSSYLSDSKKRHLLCRMAVSEAVPSFAQFFDSLREFVGAEHVSGGRWGQGDGYRKSWQY
jgi:hypothetical protein